MFVKICGITNREDALAAVDAGASALGFIFYPRSPRAVTPEALEPWLAELPSHVWKVGVFVDESPASIGLLSRRLSLDIAQLHGRETPELYPSGMRVWKAIRIEDPVQAIPETPAEALLFDGPGSGRTFDWSVTARSTKPFILAGGLTPANIREAIASTQPWGVDAASGIESAPGRKDHARLKLFIKEALRS